MTDQQCVEFLQWALPQLQMRWRGFRKVRHQVRKRIDRRIRQLGLADVSQYRTYLESHREEWATLDAFCRIPISRFYRDRGVFDLLGDRLLPELAEMVTAQSGSQLSCWSAGCGSGEEVYTLALLWETRLRPDFQHLRFRVMATDADPHMLKRARQARYAPSSLKDAPEDWLQRAFTRDQGDYVLRRAFQVGIEYRLQDIRAELPDGPFHLVLCRHLVFTYFAEDLQLELLRQIVERILPGGYLITGKQEPLPAGARGIRAYGRNLGIYQVASSPKAGRKPFPGTVCRPK